MATQTLADSPSTRAEATRARIEETAERLFRSMGYQKTAVADIARELGMSPANVYRFFPSKSAINEAIAQRSLGAILAELEAIARGEGSAAERLRRMFSRMFESKIEVFFAERRLHDMVTAAMDEHWNVVERHIAGVHAAICHVVSDGMRAGEFALGDPVKTSHIILHTMVPWNHPALVESCIARKGQTVEELRAQVADMTEFVLRALRP
ncbi:TetR/AcrR family transcriptional regulator [Paracraurococcus lichenis]|uniref:TetR family transcriptional regulator n=1 Tax=Paracraurococcus lichenis TaxID=3064888 RepID=A0ABT9DVP8_9PROT|nr:TetR family transcriptional regulator [Paracraurococcus sp. LOR1-02]MDO9707964.1 TetR family transcriptional regulator [Paracraurococcus sp. LOR1-02]